MSKPIFNCYIDEAGDEGFKKEGPSRWFILASVIVREEHDLPVSRSIDRIKHRLSQPRARRRLTPLPPRRPIHFRELKHQQKNVAVQEIADEDFVFSVVAFKKHKLTKTTQLKETHALYFYATRYLLERASWYVDDAGGKARLVFSNRSGFPYSKLDDYIKYVTQAELGCQIRHGAFFEWDALALDQRKMLQVADICASLVFNAFEPDEYGNTEDSYLKKVEGKLYRRGKASVYSYGMKIMPTEAANEVRTMFPWLR